MFLFQTFGSLLACLLIPFFLASINVAMNPLIFQSIFGRDFGKYGNITVILCLSPILPFILILMQRKSLQELKSGTADKVGNVAKRYKLIKAQTARFIKTELGIETTLQLTFSVLLSFFSTSQTRTSQGLEALFKKGQDSKLSKILKMFNISPVALIVLTNLWSCFSAWRAFVKGLSTSKDYFPTSTKGILALYVLLSILIRATSIIIFLAPCLGLFNLLRHFQGESYPYWIATNQDVAEIYYSTADPVPMKDFSRFDYSDKTNPKSPELTIYTYFDAYMCLMGFWFLMVLQSMLVVAAKKLSNPKSFGRQPVCQLLSHAFENCQIPCPLEDWDDFEGTISEYKLRQKYVSKEMRFTTLANLLVHLIMMIPMSIFGKLSFEKFEQVELLLFYFSLQCAFKTGHP